MSAVGTVAALAISIVFLIESLSISSSTYVRETYVESELIPTFKALVKHIIRLRLT